MSADNPPNVIKIKSEIYIRKQIFDNITDKCLEQLGKSIKTEEKVLSIIKDVKLRLKTDMKILDEIRNDLLNS